MSIEGEGKRNYTSLSVGEANPFALDHVKWLGPGYTRRIELVESRSGEQYVLRDTISYRDRAIKAQFDNEIKLLKEYGIPIVDYSVIGARTSDDISQKDEERRIEDKLMLAADFVKEEGDTPQDVVDRVAIGLIKYHERKFNSEEPFLQDITKLEQYVYGSFKNKPKDLYLVDLDIQNSSMYSSVGTRDFNILYHLSMLSGFSMGDQAVDEMKRFIASIDPSRYLQNGAILEVGASMYQALRRKYLDSDSTA